MTLSFALVLPALLGVIGVAADYASLNQLRGDLQAAADAAALAAAQELALPRSEQARVTDAAKTFASFQLSGEADAKGGDVNRSTASPDGGGLTIEARVLDDGASVQVNISRQWQPFFAHFLQSGITPVRVKATARYMGTGNICVVGLSPSTVAGVTLWNNARLSGNNCGVYSNTKSSAGLVLMDSAELRTKFTCVAGGYKSVSAKSIDPTPVTDCPPLDDPLKSRPEPSVKDCDFKNTAISNGSKELQPGVYCGGIRISGSARVTLRPGVYVIKDGPLTVSDSASLEGKRVGFYLTGFNSLVWFMAKTTINLEAPVDGLLAGILFFENRKAPGIRIHRIGSNNARTLLGTIYLSKSVLNIDADAPVADQSAYTAIVTQSLQLQSGPHLTLNSDYDMTDVPVPAGIAGTRRVLLSN